MLFRNDEIVRVLCSEVKQETFWGAWIVAIWDSGENLDNQYFLLKFPIIVHLKFLSKYHSSEINDVVIYF